MRGSSTDNSCGGRARPSAEAADLLRESLEDLRADFDELAYLARSTGARLGGVRDELHQASVHVLPSTLRAVEEALSGLGKRYGSLHDDLLALLRAATRGSPTPALVEQLTREKRARADLIRVGQAAAGALMTATDWQSPSVLHAVHASAGRFTGLITEHVDDYKRDRHADAERFERTYLDEYVGPGRPGDLRALMTSCGMSAFTTILAHLAMEAVAGRPALVGRSAYHECKDLLAHRGLGGSVVEVDETRPETVLHAVAEYRPGAIFLDSLCNAKGVVVPDLAGIVDGVARAGQDVVIVVDNTGLSCAFDPMSLMPAGSALRMIVFESLTKYAQLGLDRTPAGMITARGSDAESLDRYREHLGTNVSDVAACMMPWPNRPVFQRRLGRLGRNAFLLASALDRYVERGDGLFSHVDHPGLDHHTSFRVARNLPFQGGFFGVALKPAFDRPDIRRRFVRGVIEEARAAGTPVVAGPSFGLNTTRVYHTTSSTELGRPFIRISAGTEHRLEVEALTGVIIRAADRLAKS